MKRNCKKWYTLKSTALISTLLIVTGVFTACGKSDKEDIARDLSENVTSDFATKSDAVQEEIPKSLSYTVGAGGSGAIKVEAEVYSEGYGQVPTYKLKKKDKNDEWVKSYAEKLFDNGEYINVKPYDFCSMEELEAEKQFWEERLKAFDEGSSGYDSVEELEAEKQLLEEKLKSLDESNIEYAYVQAEIDVIESELLMESAEAEWQRMEERLKFLEENGIIGYECVQREIYHIEYAMEDFSESNYVKYPENQLIFTKSDSDYEINLTSYYEGAQLRGEVDGNVWLLRYHYGVDEYEGEFAGRNVYVPILYGYCAENADYIEGSYGVENGIYINKCDREKAESEAEKLLDRLGFNNMECVKMTELHPFGRYGSDGEYMDADYCDGYSITYGPSLSGIKMFSDTNVGACVDGENIAVQPYVSILVNSKGAYSFCIMEDYDVEEMLSENSQMLSFQQIDDIARTEFEKKMKEHPDNSHDITKVKFEYLCVTYDGISYAMLPVWTYYKDSFNRGATDLFPFLIVNALDGAVIPYEFVSCGWEYYSTMQ